MKIILSEGQVKKLVKELEADVVKGLGAIVYGDEDEMDEKNSVLISIDKLFKNQPEDQSDFEKDYDKMVDDISKKTKKNHKFRPLVVAKEGKKYRILDGHHRYDAYKKLGKEKIRCIVIDQKDVKFKKRTKKIEKELGGVTK